jgi:CheY-like chemotaxis protein
MRSVLVALRNPSLRESVQRDLEGAGYITYTAGKATTSLTVLHMCPEELLVLLDARLPVEGSAERMLRRRDYSDSIARHRYILCADTILEHISPQLAQLAHAQRVPVLHMPCTNDTLRYVVRYGELPSAETRGTRHSSGGPILG